MTLKVLIIDDSQTIRDQVQLQLETAGFEVLISKTFYGIPREISRNKPDFVVLDLDMPAVSGEKIGSMIRDMQQEPEPKIIVHSSAQQSRIITAIAETGAIGFVKKGGDIAAFIQNYNNGFSTQ